MKRRALLETYHVASTAARIIAHALVTQLAYFACSWPWLQNRSYTENHHPRYSKGLAEWAGKLSSHFPTTRAPRLKNCGLLGRKGQRHEDHKRHSESGRHSHGEGADG